MRSVLDIVGPEVTQYHIIKSQQSQHEDFLTAKAAAENSLSEFILQGWHVLEPAYPSRSAKKFNVVRILASLGLDQ
jgi:hypothetical protein